MIHGICFIVLDVRLNEIESACAPKTPMITAKAPKVAAIFIK